MGLPSPSRENKFSGANGDKEKIVFPVKITTSRVGNLTRLILTLAMCDDHINNSIVRSVLLSTPVTLSVRHEC